jgi:hypothetical protein
MAADVTYGRPVVYAGATSVAAGTPLPIHLTRSDGSPLDDVLTLSDDATGRAVLTAEVAGPVHRLPIPADLPSGLYRASLREAGEDVYFVVRTPSPGSTSRILVSVPFLTWQAYNRAGEPGQSIYWNEQPDRAARISFDRSGGGPAPERWEHGLLGWLAGSWPPVEYCSGIDLHGGGDLLSHYRLLVLNGHDEYWTREMRDAVEEFARGGGNIAIFGANTSWWQARLEDGGRTMVCHRDAACDPLTGVDPTRVTVEWSSAPVDRPENAMTGVSFRRGAGNWTNYEQMKTEQFTVHFPEHWAFEGTGLARGEGFGVGTLGYETDAADVDYDGGVPYATGRDGTPPSFTVLATADLRHWRWYGQGGMATMGAFRLGRGTVFNAATINWGRRLDDPVVDRITRNVLTRLQTPRDESVWEDMGPAEGAVAIVACDNLLFSADPAGTLRYRRPGPQNLPWRAAGTAPEPIRCLTAPRETTSGMPLGVYAVSDADRLLYRDGEAGPAPWRALGAGPRGARAVAAADLGLFCLADGGLWHIPFATLADRTATRSDWEHVVESPGIVALGGGNGRIFAVTDRGRVVSRRPFRTPRGWDDAGAAAPACAALAVYAGHLIAVDHADRLRYRELPVCPDRSGGHP